MRTEHGLKYLMPLSHPIRLASVGIQGKERAQEVGKLGWHGNFDTGFERNTLFRSKSRVKVF